MKVKSKIWLSLKPGKGKWCYGLARFEDGSIQVVERYAFMGGNFSKVGSRTLNYEGGEEPIKLYAGERKLIIQDIYLACRKELGLTPPDKTQDD